VRRVGARSSGPERAGNRGRRVCSLVNLVHCHYARGRANPARTRSASKVLHDSSTLHGLPEVHDRLSASRGRVFASSKQVANSESLVIRLAKNLHPPANRTGRVGSLVGVFRYGVPDGAPAICHENAKNDEAVRSIAGSTVE